VNRCGPDVEAAATLSNNAWIERSGVERRSGKDKRRSTSRAYFLNGGRERRRKNDRRQSSERRDGWLQVGAEVVREVAARHAIGHALLLRTLGKMAGCRVEDGGDVRIRAAQDQARAGP